MNDEFDERLFHEFSFLRIRCENVNGAVHGKHTAELRHLRQLAYHAFAAETGQTIVPQRRQQLLNTWMSHKLIEGKRKTMRILRLSQTGPARRASNLFLFVANG